MFLAGLTDGFQSNLPRFEIAMMTLIRRVCGGHIISYHVEDSRAECFVGLGRMGMKPVEVVFTLDSDNLLYTWDGRLCMDDLDVIRSIIAISGLK